MPGWTLVEQVFICGNVMFCDNYITGGGTPIGADAFVNGQLRTDFLTLSGIAPGQPFNITEVFHIVSDGPGAHLADRRSDLKSATGPRCASFSGLTIELMLVI